MKLSELPKGSYVYRYKHVSFTGPTSLVAPRRQGGEIDSWDRVFPSKESYFVWYEGLIAGLANLGEVMNYCEYFVRERGQIGNYVRDRKSFPVKGDWDGDLLDCSHEDIQQGYVCCSMRPFKSFLEENGWVDDWFLIKKKYSHLI